MDALLLSNDNDDKDTPRTLIPDRNKSTNIEIGGFFDPSYMKKAQASVDSSFKDDLKIPVVDSNHKDFMSLNVNSPHSAKLSNNNETDAPIFLDEYNKVYEKFSSLPLILEGPELQ